MTVQRHLGSAADGRQRLFGSTKLAERIELAEARLIADASVAAGRRTGGVGFVTWIARGVASFAEPGSPLNKVTGLGFAGLPDAAALAAVERAFAVRDAAVQVELANLADPAIGALLTGRGYQLVSYENVLGVALPAEAAPVVGVDIARSGDDEVEMWLDVVVDGFAHPDGQGVATPEEVERGVVATAVRDFTAADARRYLARRDGVIAGGASMRITDGVAQLTGAATTPQQRRRGVQTALLSARLADAADAGCDIAVVTTQPGSKSQQNVQRRGFDLLYTRAVLVKEAP